MSSIDQTSSINPLLAFLWWCSGAEPNILKDLPAERSKYTGIGGAVFTAGLFASLSGGYAFYATIGEVWLAFVGGVLWGAVIFNIDRYIVSTMINRQHFTSDTNYFLQNLLPAIPRLLLAALIGIVISMPIKLALFRFEIEKQVQTEQERPLVEIDNEIARKEAELTILSSILQDEAERLNEVLNLYLNEVRGTSGSGLKGQGPLAEIKRNIYEQAEKEFRQTKVRIEQQITETSANLAALKYQRQELLSRSQQTQPISFVQRLAALSVLAQENSSIARAGYMITLLIILIEISPILAILLSPIGVYEAKLDSISAKFEEEPSLYTQEINSELQKAFVDALDHSPLRPKK